MKYISLDTKKGVTKDLCYTENHPTQKRYQDPVTKVRGATDLQGMEKVA